MLEWSEPVISDRLRETYRVYVAEEAQAWSLARQHCRAWRALIAGEADTYETLRRELVAMLEELEIDVGCVAAADARALSELNDIVAARFQRCRREARGYRLALVELAERLAPSGELPGASVYNSPRRTLPRVSR